jgi:hypothetical protein
MFQHEKLLQMIYWFIAIKWYNHCNCVEGLETDLYDVIGSYQWQISSIKC